MTPATLLLVGGDTSLCKSVQEAVSGHNGFQVEHVAEVEAAIERIRCGRRGVSLAIIYATTDTERLLAEATTKRPKLPTMVVLEEANLASTIRYLQLGAIECLCRPLSLSRLSLLVNIICARREHKERSTQESSGVEDRLLLQSTQMTAMMDKLRLVARLETTVLLTGETGTGKSCVAELIHSLSPHQANPFLTVNCGSLPPSLIESELFGHRRGAFTGADRDYAGKLAQAGPGTILLDDVDVLPLEVQANLLRVVEDRKFEAVGSENTQRLEARLIATSNKCLQSEAARGRFRPDLFYRLNVASFQLPPLRQRREEIGGLATHLLSTMAANHGVPQPPVSEKALAALQSYQWPGNIRELRNVMESALILSAGERIDVSCLPDDIAQAEGLTEIPAASPAERASESGLAQARREGERRCLLAALESNDNNRTRTAKALGISRVALYKKLRLHSML